MSYKNLIKKGSRLLLISKFCLEEMSAYQVLNWLNTKTNGRSKKERLETLGREYAETIMTEQIRQAKDAAMDAQTSKERQQLMSSGTPLININVQVDTKIQRSTFDELQRVINKQLNPSTPPSNNDATNSSSMSNSSGNTKTTANKKHVLEKQSMYNDIVNLKKEADVKLNKNARDPVGIRLLNKAVVALKKLDARSMKEVLLHEDTIFSTEIEKYMTGVDGGEENSPNDGIFNDRNWQRKVQKGSSLTKLEKLLTAAGGEGKVKISWSRPQDMNLLWLDHKNYLSISNLIGKQSVTQE